MSDLAVFLLGYLTVGFAFTIVALFIHDDLPFLFRGERPGFVVMACAMLLLTLAYPVFIIQAYRERDEE